MTILENKSVDVVLMSTFKNLLNWLIKLFNKLMEKVAFVDQFIQGGPNVWSLFINSSTNSKILLFLFNSRINQFYLKN